MEKSGKKLKLSVLLICLCVLMISGLGFYIKNCVLAEENMDAVGIDIVDGADDIEPDSGLEQAGVFTETQHDQNSDAQMDGIGIDTVGGVCDFNPDDNNEDEKQPLTEISYN